MTEGLVAGGYSGDLEIYDWTNSSPGITALLSYQRNLEEAQTVADKIVAIHRRDPDRPIYLTGHSGGTGIVVWALERLPDEVKVDRVLLLSSALSPTYDLSRALRHVRTHAYSFWSDQDVAVLSTGTTLFGTINGVKEPAAGFAGFKPPADADDREYLKLQQFAYNPDWAKWGNNGGHIGPMSRDFASRVLAPLVSDSPRLAGMAESPGNQR